MPGNIVNGYLQLLSTFLYSLNIIISVFFRFKYWFLFLNRCFQNELAFVNEMLKNDVRNNSVWNHRYFILNISEEGFSSKIISEEINYIIDKLQICLNNESVWNYLRG